MKIQLVSVIVPTYNRHEMLRNALLSLTSQQTGNFDCEIIVIDNGSTDSTRSVVAEIAASSRVTVSYVREETQVYSEALNRGVREARGAWLAFFDDDQLAEPNWLEELLSAASLTKAQLVGGCIRVQLPPGAPRVVGPICRGLLGEQPYDGTARVCLGKRIPSGGNMMIAREVFNSIGLFDTSMAIGGCDCEFITRARAAGFTVATSPALVHHVVSLHRVRSSYLRWTSMRHGCVRAYVDCKNGGRARLLCLCVARIGQLAVVNLPLYVFSVLTRNPSQSLDRKCLLWRAFGYACATAAFAAPGLVRQTHFFRRLEFRTERTAFSQS